MDLIKNVILWHFKNVDNYEIKRIQVKCVYI